ncbi:hypothetical protein TWF106_010052 [Orbilia oligospora]|uniref:Uncharacterized protein n=1 Tax=Orbilia oligospora TaxID=2813651 RepID=A0A7C8UU54_ORBOL|nr:hypothetical protein TWF106_010052 [Orbilia oligospora]
MSPRRLRRLTRIPSPSSPSSPPPPPPINYPHPLEASPAQALSYHDQCLREFSAAIRNKPNWTTKVTNRKLMVKWIREAALQDSQEFCEENYLVPIWDTDSIKFVTEELVDGYKAYVESLREEGSCIEPDLDCVWRADGLVEEEVRGQLIDAVATLENVPEKKKDWHPGSGGLVLDLVHPSMWPIIYGKTISSTDGKPIQYPKEATVPGEIEDSDDEDDYYNNDDDDDEDDEDAQERRREEKLLEAQKLNGWSTKFCWLPSLFQVSPDGKSTKIKSYINNLSTPDQKELFYPILEKIFTKFVPMFNHVLADLAGGRDRIYRTQDPNEFCWEGRDYHIVSIPLSAFKRKWEKFLGQYERGEKFSRGFTAHYCRTQRYEWGPERDEIDSDWNDRSDDEEEEEKKSSDPGIGSSKRKRNHRNKKGKDSSPYDEYEEVELWDIGKVQMCSKWSPPHITDQIKLEGKAAKVIVKLANIVLTPKNPKYNGGSWHVEAMKNERILATGIYYYAQENITDSTLSFRRTASVDQNSQWSDSYWTRLHAMVFPNVYQHCVSPFTLTDPKKPGYRKILVFFLCDPNHDVPTTETVMPQQPEQRIDLEKSLREGPLGGLPEEIFQGIVGELPPLITLDEAREYRSELMEERSSFMGNSSKVQGRSYNLCEH